ncbi:MAG: beta-lactamase family protein [Planctomycetes bacterium]|nr:beta-lactamase family protein [Planctomycetota bacterium]
MICSKFFWLILSAVVLPINVFVPQGEIVFPPATPESQGLHSENLEVLAAVVEGYVADREAVGAELLVIKNRHTVLHRAFGWKDYEGDHKIPMEKDTIFNIRSMTKPLIGTAIQMLIDEGRLAPDDPVYRYLPAFDTESCRAITVEHLLTHRSGLPLGPLMSSFYAFKDLAEAAAKAAEAGPEFTPGTRFQYSDPGSDTLAALAAAVADQPAGVILQQRILDPLGMNDTLTVFDRDDPRASRVAALFAGRKGAWQRVWKPYYPMYPFTYGSQSLYATPMDYARFLLLWLDGGNAGSRRMLSKEAIRRAWTPRSDMAPYPSGFPGLKPCYGQMWTLYIAAETDEASLEKARPEIVAHGGSDGTKAWAWPELDLIVCYFTQSRGGLTAIDLESEIDRLLISEQR